MRPIQQILNDYQKLLYRFVRERSLYISGGVALLVLIIGYGVLLGPKISVIREEGILDYDTTVQTREDKHFYLQQLEGLRDRYNSVSAKDIEKLRTVLPSSPEIPELFVMMDSLMADAGFTLNAVTFSFAASDASLKGSRTITAQGVVENVPALPADIQVIKISTSIIGKDGYDQFKRLLTTIERNARLLNLTSFSYHPGTTSYQLSLETFYRAP